MAAFNFDDDDFDIADGSDTGSTPSKPAPAARAAQKSRASSPADLLGGRTPVAKPQPVTRPVTPSARPVTPPVQRPAPGTGRPTQRPVPRPQTPVETSQAPVQRPNLRPSPTQEQPGFAQEEAPRLAYTEEAPYQQSVRDEPRYVPQAMPATVSREADALFTPGGPVESQVQSAPISSAPKADTGKTEKKPSRWVKPDANGERKGLFDMSRFRNEENGPSRGAFAGKRRRILAIYIIGYGILGILTLKGLHDFVLPNNGPTYDQVQGAARAAVGDTGFPSNAGGAVAVAFTKAFFNYSSATSDERDAVLGQYTTATILQAIDATFSAPNSDNSGATNDVVNSKQAITDGPYLLNVTSKSATSAIATVMVSLSNGRVVYLQVPLLYDNDSNAIAVNGYPTFTPAMNLANPGTGAYTVTWDEDNSVEETISSDMQNYLSAWASSDSNLISRYTAPNATLAATRGLNGVVQLRSVDDLSVASYNADDPGFDTADMRHFQVTVTWYDPVNKISYPQVYRGTIVHQGTRWYVQDLENASVVPSSN